MITVCTGQSACVGGPRAELILAEEADGREETEGMDSGRLKAFARGRPTDGGILGTAIRKGGAVGTETGPGGRASRSTWTRLARAVLP